MSCCCDEDDGDILHFQRPNPSSSSKGALDPSTSSFTFSSSTVISPMNSHFMAPSCRDTLRIIFEKLPIPDLARASCVCRVWNSVASEKEIVIKAFRAPWKLKNVVGNPLSGSFWRDNSLGKFAISHRIVRGDSVTSLAVKYSVQVMGIKRLNNMMSDHGIYSRKRLLIPVSNPDILINRTCYIELDVYAKREVAVLYPDDIPDRSPSYLSNRISSEEGKKRVIDSLKRSMQVDDETAQYYWSVSNGDPRAALSEFSEDLRWEKRVGLALSSEYSLRFNPSLERTINN